jgi:hypothetical protein
MESVFLRGVRFRRNFGDSVHFGAKVQVHRICLYETINNAQNVVLLETKNPEIERISGFC